MADCTKTDDYRQFARILRRTFVLIALCAIVVVVCYYFIDRPVAFFVHRHEIANVEEFRWLTEPPPIVQSWSPLLLASLAIRRAWGKWRPWQAALFVSCASLIVADQFRESLGDVCGRYWPETWHNDNPSLIGTGAYGFHPFEIGDDTGSFPSGHSARIVAFFYVFWLLLPRARWLYVVVAVPMLLALVAMNYHFVSDIVAGSVIGGIIGAYAVALTGLQTTAP
jgi:membrane-associated phospholipid phosphatase